MPTIELVKNPDTAEFCTDVTDITMGVISRNSGLIGLEAAPPTNDPDPIVVSAIPFSPEEGVDESPEKWGWFASIGYAFWHLMETLESIKEKILRKQAPENLSNGEKETSSDGDEVHNHSKSYFESMNIFAWIPYFGSFFSTRNETKEDIFETANSHLKKTEGQSPSEVSTAPAKDSPGSSEDSHEEKVQQQILFKVPTQEEIKKKAKEIIDTLENQRIPRIPEEFLSCFTYSDLRQIHMKLFIQCWVEENVECSKSTFDDLEKCSIELDKWCALQTNADQERAECRRLESTLYDANAEETE